MLRSGRSTLVLGILLMGTTISTVVLAILLYRAHQDKRRIRHQAWGNCRKLSMQHILYERARARAQREGRKLVVIGNPTGGWVNKVVPIYGCGDICIDIAGCRPCGPATKIMKMDATEALRRLPADSAVVFESEVFEYVSNMQATVKELDRITGGDHTRIFAVHTASINNWAYHCDGVRPEQPTQAIKRKRRERRKKYAKTGEGLARRIIYRFPPRDRYTWSEL